MNLKGENNIHLTLDLKFLKMYGSGYCMAYLDRRLTLSFPLAYRCVFSDILESLCKWLSSVYDLQV